jgi:hypothetical protein
MERTSMTRKEMDNLNIGIAFKWNLDGVIGGRIGKILNSNLINVDGNSLIFEQSAAQPNTLSRNTPTVELPSELP